MSVIYLSAQVGLIAFLAACGVVVQTAHSILQLLFDGKGIVAKTGNDTCACD